MLLHISSAVTSNTSDTLSITCCGVTSTPCPVGSSIGATDSTVIGSPVMEAKATARVRAPSNSRMFEVKRPAMYWIRSRGSDMRSCSAFF